MELFQIEDTKSDNFPTVQIPTTHTEQQYVAILHADIRNFSQLAEKYSSEAIIESLNLYFSTWGNIAQKYGGVIDKYMGDAIVILFPPTPSPDDDIANRSVTCALNFLDQLQNFQEEFAIRNLPIIQNIGIGISCGDIILAEIGSPDKKMKTAIGHPISIASRMQSLCREFHQDMVIDQNIYKKLSLENQALFLLLGEVLVRGKTAPMPVYGRK
jgi:adenylate cyclase